MDPFALQQAARKRTSRLVVLAAVAVLATAVATGFVALLASWGVWLATGGAGSGRTHDRHWTAITSAASDRTDLAYFCDKNPEIPAICFALSLFVILARWLYRYSSLSSGASVMKELGARQLHRSMLADDDENASRLRFFNVCEEMSIASGLDMPSVWILEDVPSVNALAAGTVPSAAAVCVTRGAIDGLTRDELQGVVAHEFSHILNGDMQLNMRITALIAGITAVSRIGRGMLSVFDSSSGRGWMRISGGSRRGGKSKGGGAGAIILIYVATAVALWIVGSIGAFFARLVQCAVSRQREFLADASAAQFTRNPEALARALRFAGLAEAVRGGRAFESWKGDVSHMLFAGGAERLLATHPSIAERIRRLCPRGFDDGGVKDRVRRLIAERKRRGKEYERRISEGVARNHAMKAAVASLADAEVQPSARAAVRDPARAGETLVALLRGQSPEGWSGALSGSERRTLALKCVNTLRDGATPDQRRYWADEAERVVQEDGVYDSFEMMVMASVRRRLLSDGRMLRIAPARTLLPVAARVIATVASFGRDPAAGYAAAGKRLSLFGPVYPPMPAPYGDADDLIGALDELLLLPPLAKKELLTGLKETVAQDGVVTDEEANYLAAVADAIGAYGWMQNFRTI